MHGLAGYFEAILYGDVGLSIHPNSKEQVSKNMLSWFPLFFPFRVRFSLSPPLTSFDALSEPIFVSGATLSAQQLGAAGVDMATHERATGVVRVVCRIVSSGGECVVAR